MNPKASSTLFAIAALLLFGVSVAGAVYVAEGVLAERASADDALAQSAALSNQATAMQQKAELALQTKLIAADLNALAIPSGGDADFISSLETLAAQTQVTLTIASVMATPPAPPRPGTLVLSLQTQGTWAASMRFLELLETEPLALTVGGVTLTYDPQNKIWAGTMAVSVLSYDSP